MSTGTRQRQLVTSFVSEFLKGVGEDISRDGLRETPERVGRLYS